MEECGLDSFESGWRQMVNLVNMVIKFWFP